MKLTLNDVLIVHDILGIVQLQLQVRREDGATGGYQMPLHLGKPLEETIGNLHELAYDLERHFLSERDEKAQKPI